MKSRCSVLFWAFRVILLCGLVVTGPGVPAGQGLASPTMVHADSYEPFTFAVLGDRTGGAREGVFEQVVEDMRFLRPDIILTVGDLIQGYSSDSAGVEAEWDYVLELMESIGIEYHLTPGNHDIWNDQSQAIYERRVGNRDTALTYRNNLFIILDVSLPYTAAAMPEEQIAWMEDALSEAPDHAHTFVFYHKPFWCEDFSSGRDNLLHEVFVENGVDAVFTGHYHRQFYTERDGIRYYSISSSGGGLPRWGAGEGSFYSYMWVKVDGDDFEIRTLEPRLGDAADEITMDDMMRIDEILSGVVKTEEILLEVPVLEGTKKITVSVENPSAEATLADTARWYARDSWTVDPEHDYVEVPPGEVATLTAFISNEEPLFPVPRFNVRVPYKDGRTIEVSRPIAIKRLIHSEPCVEVPSIDGKLDDEVWQLLPVEEAGFGRAIENAPEDSTRFRLCHDEANLYIAVECFDSQPDEISGTVEERDGFANPDDTIMLVFNPEPGLREFYQITVNPIGTIFDRFIEICPFGSYVMHPEWDAPATVGAEISERGWTVEMAIPLEAFGGEPGSRWGFNFMRWHHRLEGPTHFQPPIRYDSAYMGVLEFN